MVRGGAGERSGVGTFMVVRRDVDEEHGRSDCEDGTAGRTKTRWWAAPGAVPSATVSTDVLAREGPLPWWLDRALALAVAVAGLAVVAALLAVHPDARGYGTHEQLGMRPCGWPEHYGLPCPTCGVTTAACLLVHLRPWQAIVTQPFGAGLALAGLALTWLAVLDLARGRAFAVRAYRFGLARWVVGGVALLLLSWWYKAKVC